MIISEPKLLLVDDEPLILDMFDVVLKSSGFDTYLANTAKEALELLNSNEFDVLVADVSLEDFDGFEIESIAKKLYPNISSVLITGAPNPIDSQRALSLGIPYLSKPVGIDVLVHTQNDVISNKWNFPKKAVA